MKGLMERIEMNDVFFNSFSSKNILNFIVDMYCIILLIFELIKLILIEVGVIFWNYSILDWWWLYWGINEGIVVVLN